MPKGIHWHKSLKENPGQFVRLFGRTWRMQETFQASQILMAMESLISSLGLALSLRITLPFFFMVETWRLGTGKKAFI